MSTFRPPAPEPVRVIDKTCSPAALAATLLQPPASAGGIRSISAYSAVGARGYAAYPSPPCIPPAEAGGWRSVAATRLGSYISRLPGQTHHSAPFVFGILPLQLRLDTRIVFSPKPCQILCHLNRSHARCKNMQ